MKCPYCGKEMNKGVIYGDRYALKWIPTENDKCTLLWPLMKGIKLAEKSNSNSVESFLCKECNKMIIDVPKQE